MNDENIGCSDEEWEKFKEEYMEVHGKRFGVEMAFPFPVLVGYEHLATEDIEGKIAFFKGKPVAKLMFVEKPDVFSPEGEEVKFSIGVWWTEIVDFEVLKGSEGHIWDFPKEITSKRDRVRFEQACKELRGEA